MLVAKDGELVHEQYYANTSDTLYEADSAGAWEGGHAWPFAAPTTAHLFTCAAPTPGPSGQPRRARRSSSAAR